MVCGGLAFLFCPIVLGPAGMILAGVAISHKERLASTAMVISVLGLVVGLILGALMASSLYS